MTTAQTMCPGCGLLMPIRAGDTYDGYYHCSPECWSVYTEVLGFEFGNPVQLWKVHQLTVDSYAVQHAGGPHPDKSVGIHLCGLHLALEAGISPPEIAPRLQRLADAIDNWPHFTAPDTHNLMTVFDVVLAGSPQEHTRIVREWAESLWLAWSHTHTPVAALARELG